MQSGATAQDYGNHEVEIGVDRRCGDVPRNRAPNPATVESLFVVVLKPLFQQHRPIADVAASQSRDKDKYEYEYELHT